MTYHKKSKDITDDQVEKMYQLHFSKKMKYSLIAKKFNMHRSSICRAIRKYVEKNEISKNGESEKSSMEVMKRKVGRPRKVSSDVLHSECVKEKILKCFEEEGASQNAESVRENISNLLNHKVQISLSTVRRYMGDLGIKYGKTDVCPRLNEQQKCERVKYSVSCGFEDYKSMIFSDESSLKLADIYTRCWYVKGKKKTRRQYVKGNVGIMIFGCFSYYGYSKLMVFRREANKKKGDRGINAIRYKEYLQDTLIPLVQKHPSDEHGVRQALFLQDNAPIHRSVLVKKYLDDNDIQMYKHPAYSPDLNPIEKVWFCIKKKVREREENFRSLDTLEAAAINAWNELMSDDTFRKKMCYRFRRCCMFTLYQQGSYVLDNELKHFCNKHHIPDME